MPSATRGWIVPCASLAMEKQLPRSWVAQVVGPLGCHVVPYIPLAMEKQLPPERVVLCVQQSQRFPLSVCWVLLKIGGHVRLLLPTKKGIPMGAGRPVRATLRPLFLFCFLVFVFEEEKPYMSTPADRSRKPLGVQRAFLGKKPYVSITAMPCVLCHA